MSIGGSDSSAGAGIQADLKTFTKLGCHGLTVITSVTAQNTERVSQIRHLTEDIIFEQIQLLTSDIQILATKTGMLATTNIIKTVTRAIDHFSLKNLVVDPVMIATSGDPLVSKTAIGAIRNEMVPRAYLITPNIPEAEMLTDMKINSLETMKKSAEKIQEMGAQYVLIKGGHLNIRNKSIDIMQGANGTSYFQTKYHPKNKIHGTGCVLSAAIVAHLALGLSLKNAMKKSKKIIYKSIKNSYQIGKGAFLLG